MRVWGSGFGVQGFEVRVQGRGPGTLGSGCQVFGFEFEVCGSEFRVQGSRLRDEGITRPSKQSRAQHLYPRKERDFFPHP